MIWLICDSLPFYAHVHTCSPSYTDEELKTNIDSETAYLGLLIKQNMLYVNSLLQQIVMKDNRPMEN